MKMIKETRAREKERRMEAEGGKEIEKRDRTERQRWLREEMHKQGR